MTAPGWDGKGLPPAAAARIERSSRSGLRTSLLPAGGAAALAAVGFEPVGEVLGSCVMHLGWSGFGSCGYTSYSPTTGTRGGYGVGTPVTVLSGSGSRWAGFTPYVQAYYHGYDTSLRRMTDEAAALGADGVVGVRYTAEALGNGNREFMALGTAVRARQRPRQLEPFRPFTTKLPGSDVAKALTSGLVPVSVVVGISVGIRHDDWRTQGQSNSWQNVEISGYTDLVSSVRADARRRFDERLRSSGADSGIVARMSLHIWEVDAGGHRDHAAQAVVVGGGLARFGPRHRPQAPQPLSMLPLRPPSGRTSAPR